MTQPTGTQSNFGFVGLAFPALANDCRQVEDSAVSNPRAAMMQARFITEQVVKHICAFYRIDMVGTFADWLRAPALRRNVPEVIQNKIHTVRKLGNDAAHSGAFISADTAAHTVAHLYDILVWAAGNVSGRGQAAVPAGRFNPKLLAAKPRQAPADEAALRRLHANLKTRDAQQKQTELLLSEEQEKRRAAEEAHLKEQARFVEAAAKAKEGQERINELEAGRAELERQLAELKEKHRSELAAAQTAAGQVDTTDRLAISEAETRRDIIDPMLATAGFSKKLGNLREEVTLPSGRADYVLYGSDGKAIAVVEAKKPGVTIAAGQEQAREYADDLEKQYGQRPLIYYTTGHIVHLWDDAANVPGLGGYPPREVEGYATADELHQMMWKRANRKPLKTLTVDPTIAGRPYQQEMIRSVTEHLEAGHRRALLVMATGTGKTRTAIALTKLLQQGGWVKNVLFLADRKALVNQAARNYQNIYGEAGVVNLLENPGGTGTVYACTYQSMMDKLGTEFSPYAFDLVIVDEAHRSIYRRYARIFEYFDAMLLGLTATPRNEIDHNTYAMFNLEDGKPVGNYGLKQAVDEGFLVPFRAFTSDTTVLRRGVAYNDLSAEEKLKWDTQDWGTDDDGNPLEPPAEASAAEINANLFNVSTIDEVLRQVLEHGIKVQGADRLGKTIIFARNTIHAELITERMQVINPVLNTRMITHESSRADVLIRQFESMKTDSIDVAVSVDMLDTGIDVPAVVNLVFFKPVYSQTKFWQMIGRGTRLCPNLLGPGGDKTEFYVFDYCGNLEFFGSEEPVAATQGSGQKSISERLFVQRLKLVEELDGGEVRSAIIDLLQSQLQHVPENSPLVRPHQRPLLEIYRAPKAWENITAAQIAEVEQHLARLPFASAGDDEYAKRFDLLILNLQLSAQQGKELTGANHQRVQKLAKNLLTKTNVPEINLQASLLEDLLSEQWWAEATVDDLELVRRNIRGLVQKVDRAQRNAVTIDIADEIGELTVVDFGKSSAQGTVLVSSIEEQARDVLRRNGESLVLRKIRSGKQLTDTDVEALEQLVATSGGIDVAELREELGMPLSLFARSVVGLDEAVARDAFADFLADSTLTALQLNFIQKLIGGLVHNGYLHMKDIFEAPYSDNGTPIDVFDGDVARITDIGDRLRRIHDSAIRESKDAN
ncbi:DEAD/DEAH box helicase family protein [Corynebacterium ulceribovis]|uniref:DEAD/DEAH box helicase family protein n=1 Tax=Corynebacterium ulceribovis TaxID=487732 RepID=UPI000372BFEA|nr:DEAD/DEAH box helicase family protein [Corynebacterium ulceribovis]